MRQRRSIFEIRAEFVRLTQELADLLHFDAAVVLAHQERTGQELAEEGEYSAADAARAEEIMLLFPPEDA